MSLAKWSLKKIEFLLSHIEDFVGDAPPPSSVVTADVKLREAIARFEVQSGLERLSALHTLPPTSPEVPSRVFERIAPFYDAGLMFQLGDEWCLTDFFWRGQVFQLENEDRLPAGRVIRDISPLQVNTAPARTLLEALGCGFMRVPNEARGFLFRPSDRVAYVLISNLPELWSGDHVQSTLDLLNRSFTF